MTKTGYQVKGYWMDEGGLLSGEARLPAAKRPDGVFIDPETGGQIAAVEYSVTDSMKSVEITSTLGAWHFVTDRAECERIGMPVQVTQ